MIADVLTMFSFPARTFIEKETKIECAFAEQFS